MEIDQLREKLLRLIALENEKTREEIAGFIVGELIGDYENKYEELHQGYPELQRISNLASDLEWSNGLGDDLDSMWYSMCDLIRRLK